MEHYEIGPRTIPLSGLDTKASLHFSLKFCVGGSSIEKIEGDTKDLIFSSVYQEYPYQIIIIG
jgi:hypothetical protein